MKKNLISKMAASVALGAAKKSAGLCIFIVHQPKVPAVLKNKK